MSDSMVTEIAGQAISEELALRGGVRPAEVTVCQVEDGIAIDMTFTESSVVRMRRITGYLSDTRNWHTAKRAELADRKCHQGF
jgi:hypothetical protein